MEDFPEKPTAAQIVDRITAMPEFTRAAQESMPRLSTINPAPIKNRENWLIHNTTLPYDLIRGESVHAHVAVMNELVRVCKKWGVLSKLGTAHEPPSWTYYLSRHLESLAFLRLELDLVNAAERASGYGERWGIDLGKGEKW